MELARSQVAAESENEMETEEGYNRRNTIRIACWNIRGFHSAHGGLTQCVEDREIDILAVSEHLQTNTSNLLMENYRWMGCAAQPSERRPKGGTGFFVRSSLEEQCSIIQKHSNNNVQWMRLNTKPVTLFLASVYAPHSQAQEADDFWHHLSTTTDTLARKGDVIILGDFNAHVHPTLDTNGAHLQGLCLGQQLRILNDVRRPTRLQAVNGRVQQSCIDFILGPANRVTQACVDEKSYCGSDHLMVWADVATAIMERKQPRVWKNKWYFQVGKKVDWRRYAANLKKSSRVNAAMNLTARESNANPT